MPREDWDELGVNQARAEADALAARIRALDDILRATSDPRQVATIKAQLVELQAQWENAVTRRDRLNEGVPQPPASNGDLDALKQQVTALGQALASDKPDEAHAIIVKSIDALTRLDARLGNVERRVSALERHVNPPLAVRLWQLATIAVVLFAGTLFWWKDSRDMLFGVVPLAGIMLEVVLIMLAVACVLLANAKLKEYVE